MKNSQFWLAENREISEHKKFVYRKKKYVANAQTKSFWIKFWLLTLEILPVS
jgi:hypothetical protein